MGTDAVAAATLLDTHARDALMVKVPEYVPALSPRSGTENEIEPDQPLLPAGHDIGWVVE